MKLELELDEKEMEYLYLLVHNDIESKNSSHILSEEEFRMNLRAKMGIVWKEYESSGFKSKTSVLPQNLRNLI